MPSLQRSISMRGPRFFADGDKVMFVHHLDGSTRVGPREATDEDRAAHPSAWDAYESDLTEAPMRPVIAAIDPPDGRPQPEEGPHARRRREAALSVEQSA